MKRHRGLTPVKQPVVSKGFTFVELPVASRDFNPVELPVVSKGFTLVELLVVIGIIALLAGMLLPVLGRARASANSVRCASSLRQIGSAIHMYTQSHKGRLPLAYWSGDGDVVPRGAPGNGATDWAHLILPYLKSKASTTYDTSQPGPIWAIYRDVDTISGQTASPTFDPEKTQTYGVHPVLFRFAPGRVNADLSYTGGAIPAAGSSDDGLVPYKLSQIKRSSEIIMVIDSVQWGDTLGTNSWTADADIWLIQGDTTSWCHQWATLGKANEPNFPFRKPEAGNNRDIRTHAARRANDIGIRFRHLGNRSANAVFVDGHVASFQWKRPGLGGSSLEWRNILLDDLRDQDKRFR